MKKMLILILLLLPIVCAANIADYPHMFVKDGKFKAIYVIGDDAPSLDVVAATVLSTALAKYPNVTTEVGTSIIDSEVTDITDENAIVIGSPCEMRSAAVLQGNPKPCYKNLAASTGHIRLYNHNGKHQLLITGLTEEDRHEAALFLANQPLKNLNSNRHAILTSSNSTPKYYNRTQTTTNKTEKSKVIYTPSEKQEENIVQKDTINSEPAQTKEKNAESNVGYGEYEPLQEMPKKKGFFGKIWSWLKGLFT